MRKCSNKQISAKQKQRYYNVVQQFYSTGQPHKVGLSLSDSYLMVEFLLQNFWADLFATKVNLNFI